MAAVVAAVVLSMVLFFRVRSVEVTGSAYYTADEIRAACGVAQGDNLLTLSRARIAGNIMAELPYVSTVQVTRRLPDTLELTVTEYDVTYAAQGADGASYLITADGKITEKIDETAARGHIAVTGLQLADPVVGQQLTVAGDDDVAAQGQHIAHTGLRQLVQDAGGTGLGGGGRGPADRGVCPGTVSGRGGRLFVGGALYRRLLPHGAAKGLYRVRPGLLWGGNSGNFGRPWHRGPIPG